MRRLVYFLKERPMPRGPVEPGTFHFAYAETVRRVDGRLEAENIQAPTCAWRDDGLQIQGFRLRDREFIGYAYRTPAPPWFAFGRDSGAEPGAEPGGGHLLGRTLRTTPLGRFCRHPDVLLALAQDRLASTLAPLLAVPDLLSGEERLLRDWEIERPAAAAHALASCRAIAEAGADPTGDAGELRLRLRRAALRRIDATAVGREVFLPCPAFFGESHLVFELDGALSFKAGVVRVANYWPRPGTEARSLAWREKRKLVRAVESRLFPLPSPGLPPERFWELVAAWRALEPLREFEASSPLPLFPHAIIYPDGHVPRGFRLRIRPEVMRSCGGSYLTLAAAGLSPYIAEPFHDYCRLHRELLEGWTRDVRKLAEDKWG